MSQISRYVAMQQLAGIGSARTNRERTLVDQGVDPEMLRKRREDLAARARIADAMYRQSRAAAYQAGDVTGRRTPEVQAMGAEFDAARRDLRDTERLLTPTAGDQTVEQRNAARARLEAQIRPELNRQIGRTVADVASLPDGDPRKARGMADINASVAAFNQTTPYLSETPVSRPVPSQDVVADVAARRRAAMQARQASVLQGDAVDQTLADANSQNTVLSPEARRAAEYAARAGGVTARRDYSIASGTEAPSVNAAVDASKLGALNASDALGTAQDTGTYSRAAAIAEAQRKMAEAQDAANQATLARDLNAPDGNVGGIVREDSALPPEQRQIPRAIEAVGNLGRVFNPDVKGQADASDIVRKGVVDSVRAIDPVVDGLAVDAKSSVAQVRAAAVKYAKQMLDSLPPVAKSGRYVRVRLGSVDNPNIVNRTGRWFADHLGVTASDADYAVADQAVAKLNDIRARLEAIVSGGG